ncbi:MAG: tetratricopeptide repeat protein [Ignavibacteriae bacterium]|nr:tetratricopeptide repeat protein [Ignavibacteriota bacterium]MCB9244740.1 tetratricopeptide repeat protein [Ignavibacteriales bacterium]
MILLILNFLIMSDGLPFIDSLWDYNDPAGTEKKFKELLPEAEASGDKDYYIQLLTQIARTYGLQRQFDKAHELLDQVGDLLAENENVDTAWVRYYLERGRAFNSAGDKEKALVLFKQAYDYAENTGMDFYAIDAAHMMAIAENPEESLRWSDIAIGMIEKTSDERAKKWGGPLYNNTGWTYHDMGDYEKAMSYFEKSLSWHKERNTGEGERIARWTVARCLRSLGRASDALDMQMELLKDIEQNNYRNDGFVFEEIGECNLELGSEDTASEYFAKAYELLSQDEWLQANEKDRLDRMKKLGKVPD